MGEVEREEGHRVAKLKKVDVQIVYFNPIAYRNKEYPVYAYFV